MGGLVTWEMLYRAIPFGDLSIAQIVGAVGYGQSCVKAKASSGASAETAFLHEVVGRCTHRDPSRRPLIGKLLESLRAGGQKWEKRRSQRSTLTKLGDKTEAFAVSLFSGGFGGKKSAARSAVPAPAAEGIDNDGPRMVRLDTGEWVAVDFDLVAQFPDAEEKWRDLMSLRARLSGV